MKREVRSSKSLEDLECHTKLKRFGFRVPLEEADRVNFSGRLVSGGWRGMLMGKTNEG